MATAVNSYGSAEGVVALTPRYGNTDTPSVFDTSTKPTLAVVEVLIDQVSGVLNIILSQEGFTTPIAQADAKLALDGFVESEVASIAEGINGSGRFGPTLKKTGKSRHALIYKDAKEFIADNSTGFARLGVPQPNSTIQSIGFREFDEGGNAVVPIFQRDAYGKTFEDWDPS